MRKLTGKLQSAAMVLAGLGVFLGFVWLAQHRYEIGRVLNLWITGQLELTLPEQLQTFITLTLSLVVEGTPFVILGVLAATIIRMFVSSSMLLHRLPRQRHLRRLVLAMLGVFMPVCECGNVPVGRSLLNQGMKVPDVTAFLLAAPIVNPITFLATWEAFGFDRSVAIIRILAAIVIALVVAAILDRLKHPDRLVTPAFAAECHPHERPKRGVGEFLRLYQAEFWLIMKMLCIGAMIAAATQTIVPREVMAAIGSNLWLSLLSMLALSLVVSICSGVDAFFALSYAGSFPIGSLLTFMLAGPMINVKTLAIMKSTFRLRYLVLVGLSVSVMAVAVGLVVNLVKA
jgi:uncharacterized protein